MSQGVCLMEDPHADFPKITVDLTLHYKQAGLL